MQTRRQKVRISIYSNAFCLLSLSLVLIFFSCFQKLADMFVGSVSKSVFLGTFSLFSICMVEEQDGV